MTDVPRRFPYGGGPTTSVRWINPKLAAARGIEFAELPGEPEVYAEPAYDEPTDNGSAHVPPVDPGIGELDFNAFTSLTEVLRAEAVPTMHGISATEHLARKTFEYQGWECDCKATAKTGIPPRHYMQYDPDAPDWPSELPLRDRYRIMIAPGRGEIKQAKGETQAIAEDPDAEPVVPTECPTWRHAAREWSRPVRDWTKGKHGIRTSKPAPVAAPSPQHPAGPTSEPRPFGAADLPPRCTAKGLVPYAASAHRVTGRQVDDGPEVERHRLAGQLDGRSWVAYWTNGKFVEARIDGRHVNLTELRAFLKAGTIPTLL